jgi:hypothetical protein
MYDNRPSKERKITPVPIMATRKQSCALANTHIVTDPDRAKVVDPHTFPDPDVIPYIKEPRILDVNPWLANKSNTNFCTKAS